VAIRCTDCVIPAPERKMYILINLFQYMQIRLEKTEVQRSVARCQWFKRLTISGLLRGRSNGTQNIIIIIYLSGRLCTKKTHCDGGLTNIPTSLGWCKRKCDLELCFECVWVEIPAFDCVNLPPGNNYFFRDTKPEVTTDCGHILDTNSFKVVLLGDFNSPGFNWESGPRLPSWHYYSNLKGMLYTPPHVFLVLDSALKLLTVLICFI
jgi:hypothetical protein